MRTFIGIIAACVMAVAAADAMAQATMPATAPAAPAASQPASQPAAQVKVVSVSGSAQRLLAADAKETWQDLKADDMLDEMTIVRTGLRTTVVLNFPQTGQVIINSATKIGIGEFRRTGGSTVTKVGMKYGTIAATVDPTKGRQDFQVATPVATLSVRGSEANIVGMLDSNLVLQVIRGRWVHRTINGRQVLVPEQLADVDCDLPVLLAMLLRQIQQAPLGSDDAERLSLLLNGGGRGIFSFGGSSGFISQLTGGTSTPPPQDDRNGGGTVVFIDSIATPPPPR